MINGYLLQEGETRVGREDAATKQHISKYT